MKKIFTLLLGLLVLGLFKAEITEASKKSLTYHSFANENSRTEIIAKTSVQYNEFQNNQIVVNREKKIKNCLLKDEFTLDKDYALIKWVRVCEENETGLTAERDGKMLKIQGRLNGEGVDKEIDLGLNPLYIYPKYSLGKFALSNMRKFEFWTLRRDKLSKLPMRARNEGIEKIIVNGKEMEVIKVYYSIRGKLREKHYHRNYYYRKSDGLYVKKEEPNGRIEELVNED